MVRLCQLKVRMRCILKALVTVELQLRSDFFFAFGCANGTKHKIDVLRCSCLVHHNTVVVQITNDRQIQRSLSCLDV